MPEMELGLIAFVPVINFLHEWSHICLQLPNKVLANSMSIGMLYTPMMYRTNGGMNSDMREARRKRSLLQTEGNAWDCAGAVRFLAGNEARWITGTILTVDAGATCAQLVSS